MCKFLRKGEIGYRNFLEEFEGDGDAGVGRGCGMRFIGEGWVVGRLFVFVLCGFRLAIIMGLYLYFS